MSEDAIEDELRAIVAEVAELEPGSIDLSGTLADAGVDSLMAMEIAVERHEIGAGTARNQECLIQRYGRNAAAAFPVVTGASVVDGI